MKNLKIKKSFLSLVLVGTMVLNHGFSNNKESVKEKALSKKIVAMEDDGAMLNKNDDIYRLWSFASYDLICNDNHLFFIKHTELDNLIIVEDRIKLSPNLDILKTTSRVNFRLGPSLDSKRLQSIPENTILSAYAKTPDNWALVSFEGVLGYVLCDYTISINDLIKEDFNINNENLLLSLDKVIYTTDGVNIRQSPSLDSEKIGVLNRYESAYLLFEDNEWSFILTYSGELGYVKKEFIKDILGKLIIIDISKQHLWLYENDNLILESDVVTGCLDTPTYIGLYEIYNKEKNRYLVGDDYRVFVNYWLPFNGGIGLHDASWRKKFGNDIYLTNGSHGCVNMPFDKADELYENVSVKTKVLVHK